jgi:hypothetical protein
MGWLYSMLTPSSSVSGTLYPESSFIYDQLASSIKITDKTTTTIFPIQEGTNSDVWVPYLNTYFPSTKI